MTVFNPYLAYEDQVQNHETPKMQKTWDIPKTMFFLMSSI